MRILFNILLATLFVLNAGEALAQSIEEKFGTIPPTWSAQISPSGERLALGCSPSGVRAICIYELDSNEKPKLLIPPKGAKLTSFFWASDKHLLQYVSVFERLNTSSGIRDVTLRRLLSYNIETEKTVFLMRNQKSAGSMTHIDSLLVDDPDTIKMVSGYGYTIYDVSLETGKAKIDDRIRRNVIDVVFDSNGKRHAEVLFDSQSKWMRVNATRDGRKQIYQEDDVEIPTFYVEGLSADKASLIVNFDSQDRTGPHHISLEDGSVSPLDIGSDVVGDVSLIDDIFTGQILGYRYTNDLSQRVYFDEQFQNIADEAKLALNADSITLISWTKDRSLFVVRAAKIGLPIEYFLFDSTVSSISPIGGEAPWLNAEALGEVSRYDYSARDGLTIPAYLTLPPGKTRADGPFQVVLMPHGGPEARDDASYDWLSQAIASAGYAVLQPNFRGSSGYGSDFRDAGYGEFGGKMVLDVIDGATRLIEDGIGAADGHCAMGWSYGGYSALMTALLDADRTICAISINGVTDPFELIYTGPVSLAYWEQYMGDIYKTPKDKKSAMTPMDRAGEYKAPLLLIHGKEDTTVTYYQSSMFARNAPDAELVTIEGDDHGLFNSASRKKVIAESLEFLNLHHPVQ